MLEFTSFLENHPIYRNELQPAGVQRYCEVITYVFWNEVYPDSLPHEQSKIKQLRIWECLRVFDCLMGGTTVHKYILMDDNAKRLLKILKTFNWMREIWNQTEHSPIAWVPGVAIALKSKILKDNTTLTTHEVFLKTLIIENIENKEFWKNAQNWDPERAAQRDMIKKTLSLAALKLGDSSQNRLIMGPRGNSASGKSVHIQSTVEDAEGVVGHDKFKQALKLTPSDPTEIVLNSQVHYEAAELSRQLLDELKNTPEIGYVLDLRLLTPEDVLEELIIPAERKSCPVILHDFETSSLICTFLRMLTRETYGKEPAQSFSVIIDGYKRAILHRRKVIELVKSHEVVKVYKLFLDGVPKDGVPKDGVLVAEKKNGEWIIHRPEEYEKCLSLPPDIDKQIEKAASKHITTDLLDDALGEKYIYSSQMDRVGRWIGTRLKDAVEMNANGINLIQSPIAESMQPLEDFTHTLSSGSTSEVAELIDLCTRLVEALKKLDQDYSNIALLRLGFSDFPVQDTNLELKSIMHCMNHITHAIAIAAKINCYFSRKIEYQNSEWFENYFADSVLSCFLFPVIQQLHQILMQRSARFGPAIDTLAPIQISVLKRLIGTLSGQITDPETYNEKRLLELPFDNIVQKGKKLLQSYQGTIFAIQEYANGKRSLEQPLEQKYLKSTLKFLKKSREDIVNGFLGEKPLVPISAVHRNISYGTGLIFNYRGGSQVLPPLLPHLRVAVHWFNEYSKKLIQDSPNHAIHPIPELYMDVWCTLKAGVEQQLSLFSRIESVLVDLCTSYDRVMKLLRKNRFDNEATLLKFAKSDPFEMVDALRNKLMGNLAGSNMFFLSHAINKPMKFKAHRKSLCEEFTTYKLMPIFSNPSAAIHIWNNSELIQRQLHHRIREGCQRIKNQSLKSLLFTPPANIPYSVPLSADLEPITIKYFLFCDKNGKFHSRIRESELNRSDAIALGGLFTLETSFSPTEPVINVRTNIRRPFIYPISYALGKSLATHIRKKKNSLRSSEASSNLTEPVVDAPTNIREPIAYPIFHAVGSALGKTLANNMLMATNPLCLLSAGFPTVSGTNKDLARIPVVNKYMGRYRHVLMRDCLKLGQWRRNISNRNTARAFEEATICLPPYSVRNEWPVIPLPNDYMRHLVETFLPEYDRILLAGLAFLPTYRFMKESNGYYSLQLGFCAGKSGDGEYPFLSITILEVSAETVEAFQNQKQKKSSTEYSKHPPTIEDWNTPRFAEFLFCILFSGYYEHEGMPDSTTYVQPNGEFIAAGITPFPGLFEIYKRFPGYKFIFNHRMYNEESRAALMEALETGIINDRAQMFFEKVESKTDAENFSILQAGLHKKFEELLSSNPDVQEFKRHHEEFKALGSLVSQFGGKGLDELLRREAQVIPLDQLGGFENALRYVEPNPERIKNVMSTLDSKPSSSKITLEKMVNVLDEIEKSLLLKKSG